MRFPKSVRLKKSGEFRKVRDQGKSAQGKFLRLGVFQTGDAGPARIGFVTTKRLGGAVVRNKTRRRLREIARMHLHLLAPGILLVIVAKTHAVGAAFADLAAEWLLLARRLSILADSE